MDGPPVLSLMQLGLPNGGSSPARLVHRPTRRSCARSGWLSPGALNLTNAHAALTSGRICARGAVRYYEAGPELGAGKVLGPLFPERWLPERGNTVRLC